MRAGTKLISILLIMSGITISSSAVNSQSQPGTEAAASSRRLKENIQDLSLGIEAVQKLRPVTFRWKNRGDYDLGFLAEEVAGVDPILVVYGSKGPEGVKYLQLTAVLVRAAQQLKAENEQLMRGTDELKAENERLNSANTEFEERLSKLERIVQSLEEKAAEKKEK
jgi:hypothetical protein